MPLTSRTMLLCFSAAARSSAIILIATVVTCAAAQQNADMDVPFVTSPSSVTLAMLDIARVTNRDFLIDLGSGDGRIVINAAKRHGARALGVEIDPALVTQSRSSAKRAGVAALTEFRQQDLFDTDLARATVITMYLLPDVNLALRPRLLGLQPGTRIVSHDWDMGDWPPDETRVIEVPDKPLGLEKTSKVMLWVIPARIDGAWCGKTRAGSARLDVIQRYAAIDATWRHAGTTERIEGKFSGRSLTARAVGMPAAASYSGSAEATALTLTRTDGIGVAGTFRLTRCAVAGALAKGRNSPG